MKNHLWPVLLLSIFLLFLIQFAGTLVESIYILDLLNTTLDAKALGLLFFFTPALLWLFRGKIPNAVTWILFGLLIVLRAILPYLDTSARLLAAGMGTGSALMQLPVLMTLKLQFQEGPRSPMLYFSASTALAVVLSVLLRTAGYGLDASLFPPGGWVGWLLGAVLLAALTRVHFRLASPNQVRQAGRSSAVVGMFLVLSLLLFGFAAPSVIARWTQGSYGLIVGMVSLLSLAWVWVSLARRDWLAKLTNPVLLAWNILFTLALTATILVHQVPFPSLPTTPAVSVGAPTWMQTVILYSTLLLFPIVYLDLRIFARPLLQNPPAPRKLAPVMLLGSLFLVLLVFMQIFTNVWGYVEPVSPWFRGKFWLPYLLMTAGITLLAARVLSSTKTEIPATKNRLNPLALAALVLIFLTTAAGTWLTTRTQRFPEPGGTLRLMTYNIQQANDADGQRSYRRQLALIREVDPDILALQESDSTRVSLNNNDYVRYFAGMLGYHVYYGPKTVTGTYGTAILSKYPLTDLHTIFSYSDQDEIGTAVAQITLERRTFTIYDVHPDGSDTAMMVFARTILAETEGKSSVIVLGDFNLRPDEEAYQVIDAVLTNAWESAYPDGVGANGTDMSTRKRIDHIFVSPDLGVQNPVYLLPPDSATDHPAHWADITW